MTTHNARALCPVCAKMLADASSAGSHASMILHKIRPPDILGGELEREYYCINCGANWLRRTDRLGHDTAYTLLP